MLNIKRYAQIDEILARKKQGIPQTEEESCIIKSYFDEDTSEWRISQVSKAFPNEWDEWQEEKIRGSREVLPID